MSRLMTQSIPSLYHCQPNYFDHRKIPHQPCPPPYGSGQQTAQSFIKPHVQELVFSENMPRTSRSLSLNDDTQQLPSDDIAYQHQSLVNRRKEEFLCNSNLQEPVLPQQPWPLPSSAWASKQGACQLSDEPGFIKTTSASNLQSEQLPEPATTLARSKELNMMQSWPSSLTNSYSNASLELANIKSSINNSQQCLQQAVSAEGGGGVPDARSTAFLSKGCDVRVKSSSASPPRNNDQDPRYGR